MGNICRHRIRVAPKKEMHMIGLDSQMYDLPFVCKAYLRDKLLQAFGYITLQYPTPALRTPDDMIHYQMYGMLFMLIIHVCMAAYINRICKRESHSILFTVDLRDVPGKG